MPPIHPLPPIPCSFRHRTSEHRACQQSMHSQLPHHPSSGFFFLPKSPTSIPCHSSPPPNQQLQLASAPGHHPPAPRSPPAQPPPQQPLSTPSSPSSFPHPAAPPLGIHGCLTATTFPRRPPSSPTGAGRLSPPGRIPSPSSGFLYPPPLSTSGHLQIWPASTSTLLPTTPTGPPLYCGCSQGRLPLGSPHDYPAAPSAATSCPAAASTAAVRLHPAAPVVLLCFSFNVSSFCVYVSPY